MFLAHVRICVERYDWTIHALCLMTTHYHLVLHSTRVQLSNGIQRLNGRFAQLFNERHLRFGTFSPTVSLQGSSKGSAICRTHAST